MGTSQGWVPPGLPGGGAGGWGHGASAHREDGLFDAGIPLLLPQGGPCEWAGEAHSRHLQVGRAFLVRLRYLGDGHEAV